MSRHQFEHENRTIYVGWDPSVTSYYMEVHIPKADHNPVVHYGTHEFELLTYDALGGHLYLHSVELPTGLQRTLLDDRHHNR